MYVKVSDTNGHKTEAYFCCVFRPSRAVGCNYGNTVSASLLNDIALFDGRIVTRMGRYAFTIVQ